MWSNGCRWADQRVGIFIVFILFFQHLDLVKPPNSLCNDYWVVICCDSALRFYIIVVASKKRGGYRGKPKQLQHLLVDDHPNGVKACFRCVFLFSTSAGWELFLLSQVDAGVNKKNALISGVKWATDVAVWSAMNCNDIFQLMSWVTTSKVYVVILSLGGVESQKECL